MAYCVNFLRTVLLFIVIASLTEAFSAAGEPENKVYSRGVNRRGWWWWGSKKKSPSKETDISRMYSILSCPLDFLSKKKCNKRGLLPYAPYGLRHTFVKIGSTCYDWGNWNYPRHLSCTHPSVDCCYNDSRSNYRGYTKCANRVNEFETAWRNKGKSYGLWSWNCQRYVDAMKDFLNKCYTNAADAIP